MSESTDTTAHEAYAFACMRCGHGWEQAYEIEHHVDVSGRPFVVYKADGKRVPSPLSMPTCGNCGGHVVRIMRPGRVSGVQQLLAASQLRTATGSSSAGKRAAESPRVPAAASAVESTTQGATSSTAGSAPPPGSGATPAGEPHHWHLSDLLHPFHRK
jgi:hypothetical protein